LKKSNKEKGAEDYPAPLTERRNIMSRTHYEYREPPLRYQTKPTRARKQYDTLGLYAYLLGFVVSVFVLAMILLSPLPDVSAGQDRLFLAIVASFTSSAIFSLLITEIKEILR
jgi:hypothetical protein